jgi:Domain of unknown function (DUF3854)
MLERHYKEWLNSTVHPEITDLNVRATSGNETLSRLVPDINTTSQRVQPDAQWRWVNDRYQDLGLDGWWCSGVDILTMERSEWGCFKSEAPRTDWDKSKVFFGAAAQIRPQLQKHLLLKSGLFGWQVSLELKPTKYEHPPKLSTEIFALYVPHRIWLAVALRYNVQLPENYEVLSFWQWVIDNPSVPIILTEGAKKAGALLSCGYAAIALPGVNSGFRSPKDEFGNFSGNPYLIPQLKKLAAKGRRIYFCFDADTKQNTIRSVNAALTQTAKLLIKEGCEINVISWNAVLGKGIDDVIFDHGTEQFDELYRNAITFDDWQSHQLKALTYAPNLLLNQRYLGEFIPPASAKLICLKSPKGTGKTEWVKFLTDGVIRSGEKDVLGIAHRVQLALQTAGRLGLPFVSEIAAIKNHAEKTIALKGGMFIVTDSMHLLSQARFNPDDWKGCWVILDEIVQVIWHLLTSETDIKKHRVTVIKNLKQVLINAEKIFLLDADLNDTAIDFIRKLIGYDIEPWIVVNEYKFEQPWTVHHFNTKSPASLIKELGNRLRLGEKHMLNLSAQKHKSKWGSINLEEYFNREIPGLKILRIDSNTVATPGHPAYRCPTDLNKILESREYDLVIASPTIETGVDIKVDAFDGVWGVFQGVQSTDSVRQHLSRYRPPVPRYVWLKPVGINRVGNGSTTVKGLIASERKKDKAVIKQLVDSGLEEKFDGNFEPICLTTWARLGAVINLGMRAYSAQILRDLQAEGHIIVDAGKVVSLASKEEAEATQDEITEVRDENYLAYRERVASAPTPTQDELEALSRQQEKTDAEREKQHNGTLNVKYSVPITSELVEKDDSGWHSQIRFHYYFSGGRQYLGDRDKKVMSNALAKGDGHRFIIDTNASQLGTRIATLNYLGLGGLLDGEEFHENHPVIQELFNKCKTHSWDIKTLLGIDFHKEDKPIVAAQRLLSVIGYKMPFLRREGGRDSRVRIYGKPAAGFLMDDSGKKVFVGQDGKATPLLDGREEVFVKWLERDELALQKALEKQRESEELKAIAAQQLLEGQNAAAHLQNAQSWVEITLSQEEINTGWQMLTSEEQARLQNLYQSYCQQQTASEEVPQQEQADSHQAPLDVQTEEINPVNQEVWVWRYSQWVRGIVKSWEYRPEIKFFKAAVQFLDFAGDCLVWDRQKLLFADS